MNRDSQIAYSPVLQSFFLEGVSRMEKNMYVNIQLFVVKKWEKYILSDRKMYVKYIFPNIFRIYKENIF